MATTKRSTKRQPENLAESDITDYIRRYIYGDRYIPEQGGETRKKPLYYCAACDLFRPASHVLEGHGPGSIPPREWYKSSLKDWRRFKKRYYYRGRILHYYRPDDCENLFAAMESEKS